MYLSGFVFVLVHVHAVYSTFLLHTCSIQVCHLSICITCGVFFNPRAIQTAATGHNNVSPTVLGVGTCCLVHANERNNCWRSSKEAIHSSTVIRALLV